MKKLLLFLLIASSVYAQDFKLVEVDKGWSISQKVDTFANKTTFIMASFAKRYTGVKKPPVFGMRFSDDPKDDLIFFKWEEILIGPEKFLLVRFGDITPIRWPVRHLDTYDGSYLLEELDFLAYALEHRTFRVRIKDSVGTEVTAEFTMNGYEDLYVKYVDK